MHSGRTENPPGGLPGGFSRFWDAAFVPGTFGRWLRPGARRRRKSDELLNGTDTTAEPDGVNR